MEIKEKSELNLEEQLWIADQAIALCELDLAIETLNQANQINPQNAEIIVRLGYIQLENNQEELARKTFGQLFSAENVDITDMKMAAHALIGLGDISSSIPYLEKALELCDYQSGDLLGELTKLHLKSGHYLAALDTIEKHIQIDENLPDLWLQKSQILKKIGRPKAAIDSINQALKIAPKSADLHSKAASMLRENQELQASLTHIQKAIELDSANPHLKLQAADIFRACLRDAQAYELIMNLDDDKEDSVWLLKKAEILLETHEIEDIIAAQKLVENVLESSSSDPKGLAIQARIFALLGKDKQANQVFENALLNFSSFAIDDLDDQTKSSIELAIGETALVLKFWDIAIFMGREAEQTIPSEPRPHLFLVKTFTSRAEYQHTCIATHTYSHAPGNVALNSHAQDSFKQSLKAIFHHTPDPDEASLINKWEQRGNYALMNHSPEKDSTLLCADDFAALIAAWRRTGRKFRPEKAKDEWLDADEVKFQLSLSFAKSQIHNAENISGEIIQSISPSPIYLANHALMANRAGNLDDAFQSIKQALSIWPDEPRWHSFAAEMEITRKNYSQAIDHLEHACSLERDNPEHHYHLGQTYLLDHLPGNAIRALQSATSLNPLETRYWMALSEAFKEVSDFKQAMISIEKAKKLSPTNIRPVLLAAEIAYANQEIKKADKIIQEALRMKPSDPKDIKIIINILIERNKTKEAMQVLDNLIDHAVTPVPLLLQKANLLGKTKGLQEKIKLLVQLTLENPKDPMVLSQLAVAYIENRQPAEAVRAAQYAVKNDNDVLNVNEKSNLHYQLGVLFQQSGQLDQSLQHLSEAVKLTPIFLDAYLDLAETYRQRREYDRAFSYLENATEIAPKDPRPFLAAGLLLKDGKDYTGSENMLRKASALAPEDVFIQRQLAAVIALAIIHQTENV
jgi:tetratricopeptide (TPR) repeat protein